MTISRELQEAVYSDFTNEEMEAFLRDHPALFCYGSEGKDALEDAMNTLERLHSEGVGTEMIQRVGSNVEMLSLVVEGVSIPEAMDILGEGKMPKGFTPGNKGNDPFKTQPLHPTSSAGKGGGDRPNPRSRTGECPKGSCSCSGYVCDCECIRQSGPNKGQKYTKTIDMSSYAGAKKQAYMSDWRNKHGRKHPEPGDPTD